MYKVVKDFFDKETGKHIMVGSTFPPKGQEVDNLRISNLLDWGYIVDEVIEEDDETPEVKPKNKNKK